MVANIRCQLCVKIFLLTLRQDGTDTTYKKAVQNTFSGILCGAAGVSGFF